MLPNDMVGERGDDNVMYVSRLALATFFVIPSLEDIPVTIVNLCALVLGAETLKHSRVYTCAPTFLKLLIWNASSSGVAPAGGSTINRSDWFVSSPRSHWLSQS